MAVKPPASAVSSIPKGGRVFSDLLRSSRLAGLAQPIDARPNRTRPEYGSTSLRDRKMKNQAEVGRIRPSNQVVHTTPASNHRADYGLKRSMPQPLKSRYITVDNLDTVYGFTDYHPGASQALVLNRIRSLNIAPHPIPRTSDPGAQISATLSPLLSGDTPTGTQWTLNRPHKPALDEFVRWVHTTYDTDPVLSAALKTHAPSIGGSAESIQSTLKSMASSKSAVIRAQLERIISRFADQQHNSIISRDDVQTAKRIVSHSPIATAGASYVLPGALKTSPDGVAMNTAVPGRLLDRSSHTVAAAGVVALSDMGSRVGGSRALVHRTTKEFVAHSLKIKPTTGQINLYLRTPRNNARDRVDRRSAAKHVVTAPAKQPSAVVPLYNMIKNALY
ncbi:hypothetical protein TRVA0_063S00430 [Trichomonascus vanleenenianus]|uniref:uncharacterized protein n=1 Tax=Trichomonascus vanleenenianus TaxID=2268995 RepID=UPI003ECA7F79